MIGFGKTAFHAMLPQGLYFNFATKTYLTSTLKTSAIISIIAIDSDKRYQEVQLADCVFALIEHG